MGTTHMARRIKCDITYTVMHAQFYTGPQYLAQNNNHILSSFFIDTLLSFDEGGNVSIRCGIR
jgi:hypothetical protein